MAQYLLVGIQLGKILGYFKNNYRELRAIRLTRNSNELFNNDSISGFHCKIYVVQFDPSSAPMVYCQDTSLNGTYLNGQLIGRRRTVLLSNRDCICKSVSPFKKLLLA